MWRWVYGCTFLLSFTALFVTILLSQERAVSIWWGMVIFCMGFLVIGYYVEMRIVRPQNKLTDTINRIHSGDRNARILPVKRNETGALIQAFNQLQDKNRDRIVALREDRDLFVAVFSQMSDAAIVTNQIGEVTLINSAAATLFDFDPDDVVGRSLSDVVRHHEIIDLWQLCAEQNKVQATIVDVRNWGLFLQVNVIPINGKSLDGYIVIISDLTRVQRLETIRRDFISNISHELKTPLASLSAIIETLRDGTWKDDQKAAKRFLKRSAKEIDTMTQMVSELLELARIESGRVPFRFLPAPLLPMVESAVEHLSKQIERKQLQVVVAIAGDLPPVLIDEERIERVIINLLHNATKFTDEKGEIVVSANLLEAETMPHIHIKIRDTGAGIPADELPRIFERFYKIDRSRHSKGTGLGLAIAKHIVQAHSGELWAESREGEGSTFHFTLPVHREVLSQIELA